MAMAKYCTINILWSDAETIRQIDSYAKANGIYRAVAARDLMEIGIETLVQDGQIKPRQLHRNAHSVAIPYAGCCT